MRLLLLFYWEKKYFPGVEVKQNKVLDLITDGIMDDDHVITCLDKNG